MTTLLLVRHVPHVLQGKTLVGRTPGVALSEAGRAMLGPLAERLAGCGAEAVYSSPLERTVDTATPIAARLGLEVRLAEELTEIDYGDWTGRSFDGVRDEPLWRAWNVFRSAARLPGAETNLELQARMLRLVEAMRQRHTTGRVILVSHRDPIRALLLYLLGIPADLVHRLDVEPGSVSVAMVDQEGAAVLRVNDTGRPF